MGLQLWMARWRQVQYMTTIHRGHCFLFKNIVLSFSECISLFFESNRHTAVINARYH